MPIRMWSIDHSDNFSPDSSAAQTTPEKAQSLCNNAYMDNVNFSIGLNDILHLLLLI